MPILKAYHAAPLDDLTPPNWLGEHGADHWREHVEHVTAAGLLTKMTAAHFATVCDLYGRYRDLEGEPTTRAYLDCWKTYHAAAKLWRLLPCDKPGQPVETRHQDKGAFEF